MAEYTLKKKQAKTLKLNIGDESFHIPLSMCLTPEELAPLDTPEGTREFFRKYLSDCNRVSLHKPAECIYFIEPIFPAGPCICQYV